MLCDETLARTSLSLREREEEWVSVRVTFKHCLTILLDDTLLNVANEIVEVTHSHNLLVEVHATG